jgi:hypothetical protein
MLRKLNGDVELRRISSVQGIEISG